MAPTTNLATLADAKLWLNITDSSQDAQLNALIAAASAAILMYLNRAIFPGVKTEQRDGVGANRMQLREWPVLAIVSLAVGGTAILANTQPPPNGNGYTLIPGDIEPPGNPQMLVLTGSWFPRGWGNVVVSYRYGYVVPAEAATIPAPTGPYTRTAQAPYGEWNSDQGVTYADGTPLIPVASGPTTGQYSVSAGVYTFAAADAGLGVLITYGFTPAALTQACVQSVGEWFKDKDHIGVNSKTLGGQETVQYSTKDLSPRTKLLLSSFIRVAPV